MRRWLGPAGKKWMSTLTRVLVDYLTTQVRVNGAWKARDKKDGERTRAEWEDLVPQPREWLDEQNPTKQVRKLHIDNLSSMATGIFLARPRNLGKFLEMRSSRPLAAVVPGTVDRVKETYPGSVSLDMSPTTLVVQDKGTNRSEEKGRLSPVTLIQLGATRIVKASKIADLALDEKPTSELTVDCVQIFGMKVDWEQGCLHSTHSLNPSCKPGGHDPCEKWQENREERER